MDRRQVLRRALGLGAAASVPALLGTLGCSVSAPRIEAPNGGGPPVGSPRPGDPGQPSSAPGPAQPPIFAGAAEAAQAERRLAGLAGAALTGPWRKSLGSRGDLLAAIREGHLAHATALRGSQPTSRPTDDPASPIKPHVAKSLEQTLDRLVSGERAQAARYRTSALNTTGLAALLWGSMSVAASSYRSALGSAKPVPIRKAKPPKPMPLLSDVAAMQQLLTQLHALNFGYPMAIGQLADGNLRNAAIRQLRQRRSLRDALVAALLTRDAEVPVAEPAYVPTVFPRTNGTAARLVRDMETRLAPFVGLWLAAATTRYERTRAFDNLALTVATANRWGGPIGAWPGWT